MGNKFETCNIYTWQMANSSKQVFAWQAVLQKILT
jgi:hypothetical protein